MKNRPQVAQTTQVRRHSPFSGALVQLGPAVAVAVALLIAGLTMAPENYLMFTGFLFFISAAQSLAWNLIGGYGGQTSFGHATFFGIGAYISALLIQQGKWPPYVAILVSGLAAGIFSLLWGYPLFRLRGFYFAIATIGVGEATRLIALNPLSRWTGGASGYRMDTSAAAGRAEQYIAALILALLTYVLSYYVRNSRLGLGLFALNMDTEAAETLGVDTTRLKAIALFLSALIVGVTGGMYVRAILYINPNDVFAFSQSIAMVLMSVIGGIGTIIGPVLGAFIYVVIQDNLAAARITIGERVLEFRDVQLGLYGLMLALIIMFEPAGIMGLLRRLGKLLPGRRGAALDDTAQDAILLNQSEVE